MKYSLSKCYSCQQKVPHNYLNKELVQNKSVLLCNFCKGYFLKNGFVPQPLEYSEAICRECHISELNAYLFQAKLNIFSKKYCAKCYKAKYGEPDGVKRASEVTHKSVLASLHNPPKKRNYYLLGGLSFILLIVSFVLVSSLAANHKARAEINNEISTVRNIYQDILNPLTVTANNTNAQIDDYLEDYSSYTLASYSDAIKPIQTIYQKNARLESEYATVAFFVDEQLEIIQSIHQFLLEPISDEHLLDELNQYLIELQNASDRANEEMNLLMVKKNIGYKYENNGIYFYPNN